MSAYEVNFDGLVGPTHNFSGLSFGNIASLDSADSLSHPKRAALQGLAKMRELHDLGLRQALLPPHERPHIASLRRLGFSGSDAAVLEDAFAGAPGLVRACSSAAPMWTANAATVSPKADTGDGRTHFTPANLTTMFHRSMEHEQTGRVLRAIFSDETRFAHHQALPGSPTFGDEGAANHTRLCTAYDAPGIEFFVYGAEAIDGEAPKPRRYPARQTAEASAAIARLHELDPARVVFAQQNPDAIDAGVFHNDVIAVGNGTALFAHEKAFLDQDRVIEELRTRFGPAELYVIEVPELEVPLADAVRSYLFNTQLVDIPGGNGMALIAPLECKTTESVAAYLERMVAADNPVTKIHFMDVTQSMRNGGGPACLRLRVVLDDDDLAALAANVVLTEPLFASLEDWVDRHYRDELSVQDLADPDLLVETRIALDELTRILELGPVYDFQQG